MKKIYGFLIATLLILMFPISTFGHDSQVEHDRDLKYVLYGNRYIYLTKETKECFNNIADAAAICIDQYSAKIDGETGKEKYEKLKVPYSFNSINLNRDRMGKAITPNTHRYYTHRGWYFNYQDPLVMENSLTGDPETEENFWQRRKGILLFTVNKSLFSDPSIFQSIPVLDNLINHYDKPENEQCDAFCCFIYNVHILGDHLEGNTRDKLLMLEPLARFNDNYGIIIDLKTCLEKLIKNKGDSYRLLIQELEAIAIKADKNLPFIEADDNTEALNNNQTYAEDVLDTLAKYMPQLLKNEDFFNNSPLMR